MHERRRLLQRLQQPVRHLVVHRVDPLQHEHAPARLERRPGGRADHRALDVVHAHHVRAGRPDPRQVRVRPVHHARANGVRVRCALRQELRRERSRHRPLPGPGRPVEEIRVRGLAGRERGRQHHPRLRVVLGSRQRHRHSRASFTEASTCACTSSAGWRASIRRQRSGSTRIEPLVRGAHRLLQPLALLLEPIGLARARGSVLRREVEQKREVGLQPARREVVHPLDILDPKPTRAALVGERRVEKPVRHHHLPLGQCRQDHLRHELRPRRRKQKCLGLRRQLDRRVLQQLPHPLARRRPAGLAHSQRFVAKRLAQQPRLRGLTGSIDALKGDEEAAHAARANLAALPGGQRPRRSRSSRSSSIILRSRARNSLSFRRSAMSSSIASREVVAFGLAVPGSMWWSLLKVALLTLIARLARQTK